MYTNRGFASFLQLTPCDLWSAFRGRTLFVSGDSQSQVPSLGWAVRILSVGALTKLVLGQALTQLTAGSLQLRAVLSFARGLPRPSLCAHRTCSGRSPAS